MKKQKNWLVFMGSIFILCMVGGLLICRTRMVKINNRELRTSSEHGTNQSVEANEEEVSGYEVKGDTIYIHKDVSLYDVESEKAENLIIDGNVSTWDVNLDSDGDRFVPNYDSYFSGMPNIKHIEVGGEAFLKNEDTQIGDFSAKDDLLLYHCPKDGVYACPLAREGRVEIPEGVWEIYDCAFQKCGKISEISIPSSVRWVGDAAFGYLAKCKKISVSEKSKYLKSKDGVLYTSDGRVLLAYPAGKSDRSYEVPDGVKYIVDGAFMGAKNLEEIKLPDSVEYIGEKVFMDCENLSQIISDKKIDYIMGSAYKNCIKLKDRPKRKYPGNSWIDAAMIWENDYSYLSYMEEAYWWKWMYH